MHRLIITFATLQAFQLAIFVFGYHKQTPLRKQIEEAIMIGTKLSYTVDLGIFVFSHGIGHTCITGSHTRAIALLDLRSLL